MRFQPVLIIFVGRQISKRLMGPDIVVGIMPLFQLPIMPLQGEIDIFHLIKLLSMSPIGPFHPAVELG